MAHLTYSTLFAAILPVSLVFSCITAESALSKQSAAKNSGKSKPASAPAPAENEPAKIQEFFQNEFARQLAKAGPKSEGWALFSESSMGHNGQRWYIKTNDPKNDTVQFCLIKQGDTECKFSAVPARQFQQIAPTLKTGDSLGHILPTVFDGIAFEYLHASNSVPLVKRAVFKTSATPLPESYENLIKAFKP